MDSRLALKWHIRIFKVCGFWPPEGGSIPYSIWTVFITLTVYILFPISLTICVLWVDSVNAAVHNLIITSSIIMVVIKGMNVLTKKKTFVELLHLMEKLDSTVTPDEYGKIFKQKFFVSNSLLRFCSITYMGAYCCLLTQVIMSDPAHRMWTSTYLYPIEFLHHREIVVDTYGPTLLSILGGHIEVLGQHLQALGKSCHKMEDFRYEERSLIKLCKKYLLIIRYSELLEEILSVTLFIQFGVSGLVLCTCAYQLTVVSPKEDTFTFLFAAVYSIAMITEIFIPSYFGSDVHIKSEELCYDLFKSNWMPASTKYKRSMQILVERTLRPISIYAARVFMLNLTTLLKILKTAYSIFAMLKKS